MVVVPALTPVTMPEPEPAVATAVLLLVHTPNGEASASAVVEDTQTLVMPVIAAGNGLTVNTEVVIQPVGSV